MDSFFRALGFSSARPCQDETERQSNIPEDNGYCLSGYMIPVEIILHILYHVPASDLIKSGVVVCKYWHHLLSQHHFWFIKLEVDGTKLSDSAKNKLLNLSDEKQMINLLQRITSGKLPFNRNLILNPSGQDEFNHWKVRPGGNGVKIECPPVGSEEIPAEAGLPTQHCFVTSYNTSTRSQVIELQKRGFHSWIIDALKPEIHITEWVSARFDCNSLSSFVVKLEGAKSGEEVSMEWSSLEGDVVLTKWYKMEKIVTEYPEGLKRIIFINSGCDHQFWAGHYGAKTAGSSVKLVL